MNGGEVYADDCTLEQLIGIYATAYELLEGKLMVEDKFGNQIYVGCNVKWHDPAIDEYEPEDREEQENQVYEIDEISGDMVCISCDCSEAEVLADELEIVAQ